MDALRKNTDKRKGSIDHGKSVRLYLCRRGHTAPAEKLLPQGVRARICPNLSKARQKLGRCRMLVVCGNEITALMSTEIGMAEKRNIICTTLDGLIRIKESGGDREL